MCTARDDVDGQRDGKAYEAVTETGTATGAKSWTKVALASAAAVAVGVARVLLALFECVA